MTLFRYPWFSARRRRDLFGRPERVPHGLHEAAEALDTLRAAFRSPASRTLSGRWTSSGRAVWHLWASDPFVQIDYRSMRTDWLNRELAREATRLPVVAVPLPPLAPFATPFTSDAGEPEPEAEEPPAIQALGGYVK